MKKQIELCKVRPGEIFELDGERFARLPYEDAEAILVVLEDALPDDVCFENDGAKREDHNNFKGSNLERQLLYWLQNHQTVYGATCARRVDLTTLDGMRDYGAPDLLIHPLTVMEYQKFRPYVPLATRAWWTATGWTTASSPISGTNYAYNVYTDGTLYHSTVRYPLFAPRPALYLQSKILVSIETEEQEKSLKDYPSVELLDELRRREEK